MKWVTLISWYIYKQGRGGNISTYRIGNLLQYFMELLLWFLFNLCILFSFFLLLLKFIQHCSTIFTQETLNNFDDVISSNKSILIKVCTLKNVCLWYYMHALRGINGLCHFQKVLVSLSKRGLYKIVYLTRNNLTLRLIHKYFS